MKRFERATFDHVGIPTTEERPDAVYLEEDGVWVTNPREHPLNIEWVRYAPDSRMHPRLQANLHLAYRVGNLDAELESLEVLVPRFVLGEGFVAIAFVDVDGVVVELMQYADPNERGWVT